MSQFHYGSITTDEFVNRRQLSKHGLNSTMVRLQHVSIAEELIHYLSRSQFHYGSITTKSTSK